MKERDDSNSDPDDDRILSIVVEPIVEGISPNVASAALRMLCSPPFLPYPTSASTGGGRRHFEGGGGSSRTNDDDPASSSTIERSVYEKLMRLLLRKIGDSVEGRRAATVVPSRVADSARPRDDGGRSNAPTTLRDASIVVPPSGSTSSGVDGGEKTLNWHAHADALHSLSSLAHVLGSYSDRRRRGDVIAGHLPPLTNIIPPTEHGRIVDLYESVVGCISLDDETTSSFVRCVGPRRLVQDVLRPMVTMEAARMRIFGWVNDDDDAAGWSNAVDGGGDDERRPPRSVSPGRRSYDRLISIASSYLVLPHSLEKLTASELSITLWSMTKIYNPLRTSNVPFTPTPVDRPPLTFQSPQGILLRAFMKRLRKYSVRSSATGKDLTRALWSVARLIIYFDEEDEASSHPDCSPSFEQLIPLPILLPGEDVSESENLFTSSIEDVNDVGTKSMSRMRLLLMPRTWQRSRVGESNDSPDDPLKIALRDEAVIMFHTLINEIVRPPIYSKTKVGGAIREDKGYCSIEKTKLESLSLWQIAEMLQAATTLHISHEDIVPAIIKILQHLTSNPSSSRNPIRQCRNCKDISRVLLSLQRLRVGSGIFDDATSSDGSCGGDGGDINIACGTVEGSDIEKKSYSAELYVGGLECRCVQHLGEKFLDLVLWHKGQSKWACDPRTLATILRSGVMMFQGPSNATKSMLDAASILILDDNINGKTDQGWYRHSFLSSCNEFEVSNCLFAFARAKNFDQGVFNSLTSQMMEDDIILSCTPSSASRTMWSCSVLLSLGDAGTSGNTYKLVDLFHQLSPLLLSSSLSSTDISSAMWAMAKSEYVIDRGIFDQLAKSMASDIMLKQSNTRLVSQALWSCGKMVEFEYPKSMAEVQEGLDKFDESDNIVLHVPPYVKSAHKFVHFLIKNRDQVSPKQISQSIWAIGRLRLSDRFLIDEMGRIALSLHASLNAREIANIIWGLSKVNYDNPEVISNIVRRIISPHITKECTAQEASMILFALGKLRICEEEALVLFASLSMVLKRQLIDATSQSIANALWAHEVLGIAPPPELLSTWAQDRLGMNVSTQPK
ncbi:hypothetical protein ACHAW5_000785 [Stephanodiscus triporus]|uniref:Uncharacterized protein n=1 Tax=Stephanodiscus triporus TaxID=2934178 RepID=A0ABD3MRF1_9STRA